MTLICDN